MVLQFDLTVNRQGTLPIVEVKGEIDVYTCTKLHRVMIDVIDEGVERLILNLSDVSYIDSTGLGTIAQAARALAIRDSVVHVICQSPQIKKIFDVSGLCRKNLVLYEDEMAAVETHNA